MKQLAKKIFKALVMGIYNCCYPVYSRLDRIIQFDAQEKHLQRFKFIGKGSVIPKQSFITNPQYISIGNDFSSLYNLRLDAITDYKGFTYQPEIVIGDNVSFNSDCHIGAVDKIVIGNNVLLSSKVYISDHYHGEINAGALQVIPLLRNLYSKGPVIIEDNVWIGEGACILPGVTIGKNAIIGANAVVTKDVPANCVVAGVPATVIKKLV